MVVGNKMSFNGDCRDALCPAALRCRSAAGLSWLRGAMGVARGTEAGPAFAMLRG